MKRRFYLLFLLFLAACVAGCGKKATVDEESSSTSPEGTEFDSVMRRGIAAVAQKDADAAKTAAEKALELRRDSAEARLLAGQAACLRKDYGEARAQFSSVSAATNEASLPGALRAKAYVGLGTVDLAQGKNDMAHVAFLQARRLDDKNEAALYYLGRIYKEYRFTKPAEDCFKKFIELSEQSQPGNSRAKDVREKILPEISRAAAQAQARSGNPTKAAQLVQLAQAQEKKKLLTKAKTNYEEALKHDPRSHFAALGYARILRLTAKPKTTAKPDSDKDTRKAVEAYGVAIDLKPDDLPLYIEAGSFAFRNKHYMQAVKIMERAVAYYPKDLDSILMLSSALRKAGSTRPATAWKEYHDALKP